MNQPLGDRLMNRSLLEEKQTNSSTPANKLLLLFKMSHWKFGHMDFQIGTITKYSLPGKKYCFSVRLDNPYYFDLVCSVKRGKVSQLNFHKIPWSYISHDEYFFFTFRSARSLTRNSATCVAISVCMCYADKECLAPAVDMSSPIHFLCCNIITTGGANALPVGQRELGTEQHPPVPLDS